MRGFNLPEGVTTSISNEQGRQSLFRTPNALAAARSVDDNYLVGNLGAMPQCFGFLPAQYSRLEKAFMVVSGSVGYGSPIIRLTHSKLCMVLQGSPIRVWNLWIEKAGYLVDMVPPTSNSSVVCIETGSVTDGEFTLEPCATHTLETTISVKALAA